MFSEKNITKFIILTPILTILLVSCFTIYFFVKNQNKYFQEESIRLENQYIQEQKNILINEVNYVINYIEYHSKFIGKIDKNKILKFIETIRYGTYGYIWIHDINYYLLSHPFRQNEINTYDISLKDLDGNFITKEFVEKAIKNKDGVFIYYNWQKPDDKNFKNKLGYLKLYDKYNWVIGGGLYIEDIKNTINKKKQDLQNIVNKYITIIIAITSIFTAFICIVNYFLSKKINEVFLNYKKSVFKKESLLEDINKNLESKIKIAIEEVQKKDRAMFHQSRFARMGIMLSMIAHQWRQPLNEVSLILIEIETALKFKQLNYEQLQNCINDSNKLIQFMSNTIDDFKNFFKPDKKKEKFNINNSCMKAISLIDSYIRYYNIILEKDIRANIEIYGYEREFSQVILNLMSNAKDALIHKNIKKPIIKLQIYKKENYLIVLVKDNAGGVEKENIDYIFEPYFTTKDNLKGTGMGLYMSKMIIEKNMGGELSVENLKNGAVFKIKLKVDE